MFSSIIPISLRTNLDMGKTFCSIQIAKDKEIPETFVRTSVIPEELGRIKYLLSDKTGTLTRNEMEFKKLHLGTACYTKETMDELSLSLKASFSDVTDSITKGKRDVVTRIRAAVQGLAICHNVTPVETEEGRTYQASSPDEIAIVRWTEGVGLTVISRDLNSIELLSSDEKVHRFEVLYLFPFTSETKRMGIIVKDVEQQDIFFYLKGADVMLTKMVEYNDWLDEECENMAREGLRTLVIGRKRLSKELFLEFETHYHEASVHIQDRSKKMQQVISTFLEHDLELLGLTGVEDRLQDNVKPTLELLRNAGIKIWMLTGDKIETAQTIAVSSRLVSRNQSMYFMTRVSSGRLLNEHLENLSIKSDHCLIIDGESLQLSLDLFPKEFCQIVMKLPSVVCCRCSPQQKADITDLIKRYTKCRIAAIGDGGNDVSMIQAAHVGIGIVGKEGKQASLAADFSLTQFCHLPKLILYHGRNNYKRSAALSQFVFHRGLIISVIQAVFCSIFYFAPIALYQGFLLVG